MKKKITLSFFVIFMCLAQAQTDKKQNPIDLGYSEWVCSNADFYFSTTENPSELKKSLQFRLGLPTKEKREVQVNAYAPTHPSILHSLSFRNSNAAKWIKIKNPEAKKYCHFCFNRQTKFPNSWPIEYW